MVRTARKVLIAVASMAWVSGAALAGPEPAGAISELVTGRIELIDEGTGRDLLTRQRSHFSFVRQVRGDGVLEGDQSTPWQISLQRGSLWTSWHTMDTSVIAPVGEMTLAEVKEIPPYSPKMSQEAMAEAGQVYVVYTRLPGFRATQLVRVAERAPGRVVIEYAFPRTRPVSLELGAAEQERLLGVFRDARAKVDTEMALKEPRVRLQVRAGATGGNPSQVFMTGEHSAYVDAIAENTVVRQDPIDINERSTGWLQGGLVPAGKVFRITRIEYTGLAKGDSNGGGQVIIAAGGKRIVETERVDARKGKPVVLGDTWVGKIDVASGDEKSVYVEVANSSQVDAVFTGVFVDAAEAKRGPEGPR